MRRTVLRRGEATNKVDQKQMPVGKLFLGTVKGHRSPVQTGPRRALDANPSTLTVRSARRFLASLSAKHSRVHSHHSLISSDAMDLKMRYRIDEKCDQFGMVQRKAATMWRKRWDKVIRYMTRSVGKILHLFNWNFDKSVDRDLS